MEDHVLKLVWPCLICLVVGVTINDGSTQYWCGSWHWQSWCGNCHAGHSHTAFSTHAFNPWRMELGTGVARMPWPPHFSANFEVFFFCFKGKTKITKWFSNVKKVKKKRLFFLGVMGPTVMLVSQAPSHYLHFVVFLRLCIQHNILLK